MWTSLKVTVVFLLLLLNFLAVPDTTLCPPGYSITQANTCSYQFGPCLTTDYDAATPTFATTCLTCYSDAHLVTIYVNTNLYAKGCIPKLCTSFSMGRSGAFEACRACAPGYFLTDNRSCILEASVAGLTTATNTNNTNSTTTNTTNSSSTTNTTNSSTTSTNTTTPSAVTPNTTTPTTVTPNTTTPSTIIPTANNTVGSTSSSSSQDYVTASIILSSGAVVCMLIWLFFKIFELIKLKPNQQVLTEKTGELREEIEIKEAREFKRRRNKDKDNTIDIQQVSFSQTDEIVH